MKLKIPLPWAAVAALWLAAFWPVLRSLLPAWLDNPDNSHCLLIPFVSGTLIWIDRRKLAALPPGTSAWGLAGLVAGLLLFAVSRLGGIEVGQRVGLVASLNGIALYNFGWPVYKKILFPMAFLLLMVPVPDTVTGMMAFPLQIFATDWAR